MQNALAYGGSGGRGRGQGRGRGRGRGWGRGTRERFRLAKSGKLKIIEMLTLPGLGKALLFFRLNG